MGSRDEKETHLSRAIDRSEFRSDRGKREPGARARARATCPARVDYQLDMCTRTHNIYIYIHIIYIHTHAYASHVYILAGRRSWCRRARAIYLDEIPRLRYTHALRNSKPSEIRARCATTTTIIYRVTGCPRSCDPIAPRETFCLALLASTALIAAGWRQSCRLHRIYSGDTVSVFVYVVPSSFEMIRHRYMVIIIHVVWEFSAGFRDYCCRKI